MYDGTISTKHTCIHTSIHTFIHTCLSKYLFAEKWFLVWIEISLRSYARWTFYLYKLIKKITESKRFDIYFFFNFYCCCVVWKLLANFIFFFFYNGNMMCKIYIYINLCDNFSMNWENKKLNFCVFQIGTLFQKLSSLVH